MYYNELTCEAELYFKKDNVTGLNAGTKVNLASVGFVPSDYRPLTGEIYANGYRGDLNCTLGTDGRIDGRCETGLGTVDVKTVFKYRYK